MEEHQKNWFSLFQVHRGSDLFKICIQNSELQIKMEGSDLKITYVICNKFGCKKSILERQDSGKDGQMFTNLQKHAFTYVE